jgi:hypothetical protein
VENRKSKKRIPKRIPKRTNISNIKVKLILIIVIFLGFVKMLTNSVAKQKNMLY